MNPSLPTVTNVLIVILWLGGALVTGMTLELGQSAQGWQEIAAKVIMQIATGFAWGCSIGWLQITAARRARRSGRAPRASTSR